MYTSNVSFVPMQESYLQKIEIHWFRARHNVCNVQQLLCPPFHLP